MESKSLYRLRDGNPRYENYSRIRNIGYLYYSGNLVKEFLVICISNLRYNNIRMISRYYNIWSTEVLKSSELIVFKR